MTSVVSRREVLGFRSRAQQLNRDHGKPADTSILDYGVQDTGPDGGLWALALRGVDVSALPDDELAMLWTMRGAPHIYRRADIPSVAAAVSPFSDDDAGKRIFDASKPLKAAGIGNLEALDTVATQMRSLVTGPMVKGEVSTRLTQVLDEPYLRFCRPCNTTHCYEQTFRLGAGRAGMELQAGTSPPVLQPIPSFEPAGASLDQHDVIRAYLRLLGPATPTHVAGFLDAPVKDINNRWPSDTVEVSLDGERRWLLADDIDRLGEPPSFTRLLGPYDLFLQAKDRQVLVDDPAKAKVLWPVLGRPGAVVAAGEIVGIWRPRKSGKKLKLAVTLWVPPTPRLRDDIGEQAERLALFRNGTLAAVDVAT